MIRDSMGREAFELNSAVFEGGWIAAPVCVHFGGHGLSFEGEESEAFPVSGGFWPDGSPVVLWRLDEKPGWKTMDLSPWKDSFPLAWQSLGARKPPLGIQIVDAEKRGLFACFSLPPEIREPGVFIQAGRIVGWTFGEWMETGYLWAGPPGLKVMAQIPAERLFSILQSRCREAVFARILASGEKIPAARRLQEFSEGFDRPGCLAARDLPARLRPQAIKEEMHSLASRLIRQGAAGEVVRILNEHALRSAADPVLAKDAVLAMAKYKDLNLAIQFLKRIGNDVFTADGQSQAGFRGFLGQLYKEWLAQIAAKGGYYSGEVAFAEAKREFPEDADIHLLGVEIAVSEKRWAAAGELLQARDYPLNLKVRAAQLDAVIKRGREEEGSVIIRFNPGDKLIPVEAYLNGMHLQKFEIDTGANVCTIPSSAVDALGIKIDESTPVRALAGVSGESAAYEVTLDSIEIQGSSVAGVKALVIDLPGMPDHGLLGLNFLHNFRVEIDKKKGLLRLTKK